MYDASLTSSGLSPHVKIRWEELHHLSRYTNLEIVDVKVDCLVQTSDWTRMSFDTREDAYSSTVEDWLATQRRSERVQSLPSSVLRLINVTIHLNVHVNSYPRRYLLGDTSRETRLM